MKNMSLVERMAVVSNKTDELLISTMEAEMKKDVDFKHIRHLIRDLHKDAIELVALVSELEGQKSERSEKRVERKIQVM